jgi:predicted GIY-YIG superfamily endonuclease
MAIDRCEVSFAVLANEVMPALMSKLREKMKQPLPMARFGAEEAGKSTILADLGRKSDFSGCYVLIDVHKEEPIYVGISRRVVQRVLEHVKGRTHNSASLLYRMASEKAPHSNTRDAAMRSDAFKQAFEESKKYIKSLSVAFIEIGDPVELYLFELYCCMELDTSRWNTFRTH